MKQLLIEKISNIETTQRLKTIIREIVFGDQEEATEQIVEFFDYYYDAVNALGLYIEYYNNDKEFVDAYKQLTEIGVRLSKYADKQGYR